MKNLWLTGMVILVFTLLFLEFSQNAFSVLSSNLLSNSATFVDSISKTIKVVAKGSNIKPGTTPDTRAPSTVMDDGIPIGLVVPANFNGEIVFTQNETATSSKYTLVSQVMNIIPINGTVGDAPNGYECEGKCDVVFLIHESNLIKVGLPLESMCNLVILHDVNDDGDFDDADEVLDTIVSNGGTFPGGSQANRGNGTSPTVPQPSCISKGDESGPNTGGGVQPSGFRVRANHVPSFSKFAVGGIINPALLLGGGGSSSSLKTASIGAPTFSILKSGDEGFGGTISGSITGNENTVPKMKVGEKIILRFNYTELSGIDNIAHVTLYLNGNGHDELQKSQTYIRWQKFEPLQIRNEDGILREAKFDILKIDDSHFILKFEIILDKKMDGSDVLLKTWNLNRVSADLFLKDVMVVSEGDQLPIKETDLQNKPESAPEDLTVHELPSEHPIPMDALDAWAGFSKEQVSDSEFLKKLGIEGNDMPSWFKKSKIAKWVKDGLISQQEFFNALSFIVK